MVLWIGGDGLRKARQESLHQLLVKRVVGIDRDGHGEEVRVRCCLRFLLLFGEIVGGVDDVHGLHEDVLVVLLLYDGGGVLVRVHQRVPVGGAQADALQRLHRLVVLVTRFHDRAVEKMTKLRRVLASKVWAAFGYQTLKNHTEND